MKTSKGTDETSATDQRWSFTAGARGLIPVPNADRPLTETQETFRNLLARMESLRDSIDVEGEELDTILSFYSIEIVPRLTRQTALQKELVRALAPFVNKTFFPRKQERMEFRDLAQELLDEIAKAERGLAESDLREIYNVVHGVGYAVHERKTLEAVRESLAQLFEEAGMEADFSSLECATSEAEFMEKAEELIARVRRLKEEQEEAESLHCGEHGHHSTEDNELRAAEEFRKRSMATVYKRLARVLHPDLERDSKRQHEKLQLMQELTTAYRQDDLHTLLRLEMQWIENEGGNVEQLTEEKLGLYNEILAGQVEALEKRRRNLVHHARYRPIVVFNLGRTEAINGPDKARELDDRIASYERCISLMEPAKTAADVRAAISPLAHVLQQTPL